MRKPDTQVGYIMLTLEHPTKMIAITENSLKNEEPKYSKTLVLFIL